MKADYLSFKRATSVCLLGGLLQFVMGLVLLVYGILGRNHTALTGGYFVLAGLGVWVTLMVLFDQHRRERVEALEAEALARGGGSSVFQENAEDLRIAAKRLAWMHRVLAPGVSLVLAAGLIALGVWRARSGEKVLSQDDFRAPTEPGWAVAIGLGCAVVGFIFARFVSGMAKQNVWANLRAGAAASVGAALAGIVLMLGQFAHYAGTDVVQRYAQVVLPAGVVVLGCEIVLNFLLNLYRPRKAGETPRPAFDSRVLGFIAAPDRVAKSVSEAINYQFGFDITSSWFYRLITRWALVLVLVGGGVVWLMTSMSVVEPHERGLRVRNGELVAEVGPGFYWKLPWPFEAIERYPTTRVRRTDLATPAPDPTVDALLWTNDHKVEEVYAVVQTGAVVGPAAGSTGDLALIAVEVPVHWAVNDLAKFDRFAAPAMREDLLRAVARRVTFEYLSSMTVDELIGVGRAKAARELRARVAKRLDDMDAGVEVLSVAIDGVHPPRDTAAQFERVVGAEQTRAAAEALGESDRIASLTRAAGGVDLADRILAEIQEAERMRDQRLPEEQVRAQEIKVRNLLASAGGKAAEAIHRARAERWERHMRERGRAARYAGQLASFRASPMVYRAGLLFDTWREITRGARVYITSEDVPDLRISVDLKDQQAVANPLVTPSEDSP